MTATIHSVAYEENLGDAIGLACCDLRHPWGLGQPLRPSFKDVANERLGRKVSVVLAASASGVTLGARAALDSRSLLAREEREAKNAGDAAATLPVAAPCRREAA